ncbi:hypothetical protein BK704_12280 [[Bacillus thuringiensis] serovar konkukian]|nr:hypothetical protein [Bacillus thuringiensis]MED1302944.1 hypothetical protein [Bacillus pacificus]OUB09076.1 hypothetical protein BK704_12280 [[Bacillus thuringiensis] serovar konkukian]
MDLQSSLEVVSKSLEIVSKSLEIVSKTDVRVVVGIISFSGVILTAFITVWNVNKTNKIAKDLGEKNLNALEQRRYIDAISAERVKWINEFREKSSEFLKVANLQATDLLKFKDAIENKVDISGINQDAQIERSSEIDGVCNQINLLLNPNDIFSYYLVVLQNEVADDLRNNNILKFNFEQVKVKVEDIGYLYHVIIRSEWKRIKEENKNGAELSEEKMHEIYNEIAKKLDEKAYRKFIKEDKVEAPN